MNHKYLWLLAAILAWLFGSGCAPKAFPEEMGAVAKAVATSMTDQAVWQNIVANVDGQVIDPGFEGGAGMMYIAYGKLRGVSGQVGIRGTGVGNGEGNSPEASAAIRAVLSDPGLIERLADAVIERIRRGVPASQPDAPDPLTP